MNQLAKPQKCALLRNGIEIWIDADRVAALEDKLEKLTGHIFVRWEGQTFNTADLTGIFLPEDLEDLKRRKEGQHKCKHGVWQLKGEVCSCRREDYPELPELTDEEWEMAEKVKAELKEKRAGIGV